MTKKRIALAFLGLLTLSASAQGQRLPAGPQALSFHSEVDDTDQPYAVYLPKDFDPSTKYPLVISLHGAGSNHRLNLRRVFGKSNLPDENDVEASRYFPEWADVGFIVASPYARGTMGYQGIAEGDVLDVLADVQRRFPVDEDRIYLTGLSMGGGGTLWLGLTRPDLWAAIAPVCPAPPPGTEDFSGNALNLPVRISHGAEDPVVKPETVRDWVARLREGGGQVEYEEYPGVGHNSWENAYADGRIFEWFARFRRNPHPERVRFSTDRYQYGHAYWVRFDLFTPGEPATIDARFEADNKVTVTTSSLDAFTLTLSGHPRFNPERPVEVTIDGRSLTAPAGEAVSFLRRDGIWKAEEYQAAASAKRAGSEGPMSEVLAERHVYVFGTAGEPSQEELDARRRVAEEAANWSVYRGPFWGRVMVFPRVVADSDVRPSDLRDANLVLFGTRRTNLLIERFADRLPIHLKEDAGEFGLVYVYPVGGHQVLVSSGIPWWKSGSSGGVFRQGVAASALTGPHDYRLFRDGETQSLAEGSFDRNWKIPDSMAQTMQATGAVTIR